MFDDNFLKNRSIDSDQNHSKCATPELFTGQNVKNSTICKNNKKLVEFECNKGEFYSIIWNFHGLVTC